jgi:hypothetical protein
MRRACKGSGTWMTHCWQASPGVLADASDMHRRGPELPPKRIASRRTWGALRIAGERLDDAPSSCHCVHP